MSGVGNDDVPAKAGVAPSQNDELPNEYGNAGRLVNCNDCGRKFAEDRIGKHRAVCKKVFVEKRKEFDTAAHRAATDANGRGLDEDPWSRKQRKVQE